VRRYLILALIGLAIALGPQPALACSCAQSTNAQFGERASAVFTGTATARAGTFPLSLTCARSSMEPVFVTFEVDSVFKGTVAKTATVATVLSGASCGYEFTVGKRYTVFANAGADGRLETGLCRGNAEGAIAPSEYGLGEGHPPG
jgi:hypothetical protein